MNFDALGNVVEIGDWLACIRNCRTSFSVFPARVIELSEKSFKVYCGRARKYVYASRQYEDCDDIRTLYRLDNTIKIFPETLSEDVYFKWREKLEPTEGGEQ
jgi:hypothetical protein